MKLKSVEIIGFKSFADKLTLDIPEGITAIVGPNGSGKSNVSDAIRWVLGEQSAKSLRGARMEDVIFAGTERRRPVNYAQVVLTLDNSDRALHYDYDEVAISRKMFRSGESEYQLNGVRCRLRDIQELLMDTGIGKDGYSIIGQGRIDQLLSNKPQDRRLIFEEAAGIVKFKTRREQANAQLAEEQVHLQRVTDILEEASSRLEPLAKQAEQARSYLVLYDELKKLEIKAFVHQYEQLSETSRAAEEKLSDLNLQLEGARVSRDKAREASERAEAEAQAAGERLAAALQEMNDLRLSRESRSGEKKLFEQQIEQLDRDRRTASRQLQETTASLERRASTLEKEKSQLEILQTKLQDQQREQQELARRGLDLSNDAEDIRLELEQAEKEQEQQRSELEQLRSDSVRRETLHEQETGQHGDSRARMEELQRDYLQSKQEAEAKRLLLEEAKTRHQQISTEILELTDAISRQRERLSAADLNSREAEEKINQIRSRMAWLEELEKEYEGYSGSVKMLMQLRSMHPEEYRGIRGTVADLFRLPARLSTAVEIALGGAVQNIVVDSQETAHGLIEELRRKKGGRATFLPLDHVSGREVRCDEQLLAMPGVIGYADTLIEYDEIYKAVFSRLLGNVVIADSFDHAAAVANRYGQYLRVVTLSGDIFNIGGSITGGSTGGGKTSSILNRKGEMNTLHRDLEQAEKAGAEASREAEALRARRQEMAVRMEELSKERETAASEMAACQSESDQAELKSRMIGDQLAAEETTSNLLAKNLREEMNALALLREHLKELEQAYADAEEALNELRRREQEALRAVTDHQAELMRNRIEISTSEQLIASMSNSVNREQEDQQREEQEVETLRQTLEQADAERDRLEQETIQSEKDILAAGEQLTLYADQIRDYTLIRDEKEELGRASRRQAEDALEMVSNLEKEQYRLEAQAERGRKELVDLQDQIWEKYELTYRAVQQMELPETESQTAAKRRMSELRSRIKELGPVNVQAIEEYEALQERCEFLTGQLEDVRKAEESLQEIIRQLTEQMEEQFRAGFGKISEQFDQVFRKMFGGGRGMLHLEEESNPLESGIEIIAQPPGKTLKNMVALSGGERALTAIAILFAIQQLKPAPFCVLDEIEAALDDANVGRFADFLKSLCDTTQFIIITHRKGTMEVASTMYGITMEEKGISKCISVKFE